MRSFELCDGTRTSEGVALALRARHPEVPLLTNDVHEFLDQMEKLGVVVSVMSEAPRIWNLIAELTYRCPLRCPYCSNPENFASIRDGLDADAWGRVFREAAALGAVHVGLTGGEPSARRDLAAIVRHAADAQLYPHLVTAGVPLGAAGLAPLRDAGLRSVQLSIQDATATASDAVAGTASFAKKLEVARETRRLGLALTLNVVLHRHNLANVAALIALARELDADRLELANAQYDGFALRNRDALMPSLEQLEAASAGRRERARACTSDPSCNGSLPDYFSGRPKPCMGGWGRSLVVVAPDGTRAAVSCRARPARARILECARPLARANAGAMRRA